eukprot:2833766-Amphidinium_carterae.1
MGTTRAMAFSYRLWRVVTTAQRKVCGHHEQSTIIDHVWHGALHVLVLRRSLKSVGNDILSVALYVAQLGKHSLRLSPEHDCT